MTAAQLHDTADGVTASPSPGIHAARSRGLALRGVLFVLCVIAIRIFVTSFQGIQGDAQIYLGRALADLDPAGVGRDMMFALDGQSAFSVYRLLTDWAVASFGLFHASLAFWILDLAVWLAAMAVLARVFARGRDLGVLLVCAAVLRCPYGFYPGLLQAREAVAVPRPLSEAAVLLAMAALCRGRPLLSFLCLAIALLVHPIMALPGFAVFFIVMGLKDRRWIAAMLISAGAVAIAAAAGAPLVSRLFVTIDPIWHLRLEQRNPYLFISMWAPVSLAPATVQCVTAGIAALLVQGRPRVILFAAIAVGIGGVALSWLFGDVLSLLLAVQVQPWRALWLVSVLAMPAFGLCAISLPRRGVYGQLAFAALALAWLSFDDLPLAPAAALTALALFWAMQTERNEPSRRLVMTAWVMLAVIAAATIWAGGVMVYKYLQLCPPQVPVWPKLFETAGLLPIPFVALALVWAYRLAPRYETAATCALLGMLIPAIALTWDARPDAARINELNIHDPALVNGMASQPGEVLWLAQNEEWYLAGRPQWNIAAQGSGIVFSRPLAILWGSRTDLLISLGLADGNKLQPWASPPSVAAAKLTRDAVHTVCARRDAPAWIVAPQLDGEPWPDWARGFVWHAPAVRAAGTVTSGTIKWTMYASYAVVSCAGDRELQDSRPATRHD